MKKKEKKNNNKQKNTSDPLSVYLGISQGWCNFIEFYNKYNRENNKYT